jgi:hypothetical protein
VHVFEARFKQYPPGRATPLYSIGTQRAVGSAVPAPEHSLSATQAPQLPTLPIDVFVQLFVAGLQDFPPQIDSAASVHCTHSPAAVSHTVLPEMWAQSSLVVHFAQAFASHFAALGSLQSAETRQSTQVVAGVSHTVFAPMQSADSRHSTQLFVSSAQTFFAPVQSSTLRHSTHV